jgi:hypothetical protein
VAVRFCAWSVSMAAFIASRSVVGATSRLAVPAKATSPRLMPGVSSSVNRLPASLAAVIRFGATSSDTIDSETSITSITTARLRGMRTASVGPAIAVVSSASAAISSAAGTCRHRVDRLGATRSSTSMLANRITRLRRARCTTRYSPITARITAT